MILTGHQSPPTYALGWSSVKPIVASGGRCGDIMLWNLEDQVSASSGFGGIVQPGVFAQKIGGGAASKHEENKGRGSKANNA